MRRNEMLRETLSLCQGSSICQGLSILGWLKYDINFHQAQIKKVPQVKIKRGGTSDQPVVVKELNKCNFKTAVGADDEIEAAIS